MIARRGRIMPGGSGLLVIALPLRRLRPGPAITGLGTKGHGLFFHRLLPPRYARILHPAPGWREQGKQPFRITPLLDAPFGQVVWSPRPGERCWLRLTFLSTDIADVWEDVWAPDPPQTWQDPGEVVMRCWQTLSPVHIGPDGDGQPCPAACPWDFDPVRGPGEPAPVVVATSYETLATAPAATAWRLAFQTPATFDIGIAIPGGDPRRSRPPRITLPLPVPEKLLSSLAVVWQAWAPPAYRPLAAAEAVTDLLPYVQLTDFRLEAARIQTTKWTRIGFIGGIELAYCLKPGEPPADRVARLRLLSALLRLAPFSGVGARTTQGMGMVTVTPLPPVTLATR